jgi:hypothetical protein
MDAGGAFELDGQLQMQKIGSRIATMVIPPSGLYKFYVFEENNLAERTTPGSGAALTYSPGDKLYVSSRGRLTSEQESVSHTWNGYVVAASETDDEGDYLFLAAAL